jgi:exonuclease III
MSSAGSNTQYLKLYGIAKLRTDIIFMSDVRICGKNLVSGSDDIKRIFLNNPYGSYDTYLNSTSNKRGVGILIKRKCNVSVLQRVADPEENFLLLEAVLAGKKCILGSIYGPNTTNQAFFQNLTHEILTLDCPNIILAGDRNCTISLDPARTNIDCLNMADIPNRTHSLLLYEMCELLNLSDPFRTLKPNAREYTYVPRSINAINRSRIDFFL